MAPAAPSPPPDPLAGRLAAVAASVGPFLEFLRRSEWGRPRSPAACDFVAGNPQEMALDAYVEAIREASVPRDPGWFAYKASERPAREAVAASLTERIGTPFDPEDVFMTKGASTALALVLRTVVGPGDEVVYVSPPWFFYEAMILSAGATPVRVRMDEATFDLDVDAIAAALSPRTRAVIVNSPNNPTGRIYPEATLDRLAAALRAASDAHGRTVYLVSDEAYNRIVFDGRRFPSPTVRYADTFLLYSYGKTLLTPGQRLGYVALPAAMPGREPMRTALVLVQLTDYGWPDAVLQHATPELDRLCIDVDHLQAKRDRMVAALTGAGYEVHPPEGTFYLLPRTPWPDGDAFARWLADREVFVLPGRLLEMPEHFRISLTATDEMIDRALPVFAAAMEQARATAG